MPFLRMYGSLGAALALAVAAPATDVVPAAPRSTGPAAPGLSATPLAPRSSERGATMFATIDAARAGVVTDNRYADPAMWAERYQEFALGAIGTGVAIGDYDNDGRSDVFVVSKTEPAKLFRNLGDWRFEDVTARANLVPGATWTDTVAQWKQGGSFADVDNDGWLDVYVQTNMLDAVASPDGRRDHLFRNIGAGRFVDVSDSAGIYGETLGHSAVWWDYDDDGWPDLYVANDFATPDRLYHNERDGTFTDRIHEVVPQQPLSSMGSDLGDVNNDGRIDFLVADMAASSHIADQRGMAAARNPPRLDTDQAGVAPQYLRNMLYLNTGTGHMLEAAHLAGVDATDWAWAVRFEDLDNDGRLDLFITNGMNREHQNSDMRQRIFSAINLADRMRIMRESPILAERNFAFRNRGDLQFESVGAAWGLDLKGVSFGAAFGDLDGDGDLDLVHTNYEAPASFVRNDADTGHRLLVALRGTRSNRFGVGATVTVASASGTQVRTLVLTRGYLSTSEPILHFGLGEDPRVESLAVRWPSGVVQRFSGVDVDQRLTITEPGAEEAGRLEPSSSRAPGLFADVSQASGLALRTRENPLRESGQQALLPFRFARRGPAIAVADLDGDTRSEIIVGATSGDAARILGLSENGQYTERDATALAAGPSPVDDGPLLAFDADGDDDLDLLITRAGTALPAGAPGYQPRLLLNDGQGHFSPAPAGALPPVAMSTGAAIAADFDRDGRLDLFLGARVTPGSYPAAPRSALLRNEGGRFADLTDVLAPAGRTAGLVTSALWTDADGDGWLDLLIATEWGRVRLFRNQKGRGFDDISTSTGFADAGPGWWTALAAADFNGDGTLDYAAGNIGLNTPYQASPTQPAIMLQGAFAGGNASQVIDTVWENGRLFPRRTSKDLAARIPSIKRRFPSNDEFARTPIEDIFEKGQLDAAVRFEATELRSGVFLSEASGSWRFVPLPRIAQIAPFQGIVAGDWDGDGLSDIYTVQNSHAPIPFVGHFSGGLSQLLRGDGAGGFSPIEPAASGLVVPGDAKAVVTLDLDGDRAPDFVCSRNNSSTMAFANRADPDRHFARVVVRGRRGNPTGVGARVRLTTADGRVQLVEITAGAGYYSQSSPDCFFGLGLGASAGEIEVRWPDGEISRHKLNADGPTVLTQDKRE